MRRTGTALAVMSVLALIVGITLVGANAIAGLNGDKNAFPYSNQVINYPSYPLTGGPYIVGATYDAVATRIVLVFNEKVATSSLDAVLTDGSDDFEVINADGATVVLTGGTLTQGSPILGLVGYENVVNINGITLADTHLSQVRLKIPAAIQGMAPADAWSTDVSWNLIGSGPIPIRVRISDDTYMNNATSTSLNAQTVIVDWNVATTLVTEVTTTGAFGGALGTPEFNGALLTTPVAGNASVTWTIARMATSTPDFLKITGGVSKLKIASGKVKTDRGIANDHPLSCTIENRPPYLIAAYYVDLGTSGMVDGQDKLWAVFSEPVLPTSIDGANTNFSFAGASFSAASVSPAFSGSTMSSLVFSGLVGDFPTSTDFLSHSTTNPLADYLQASEVTATSSAFIRRGPGIIKAIYDDGQTPTNFADDRLVVWLCEPIATSTEALIDTTDFVGDGQWFFGNATSTLGVVGGPTKSVVLNDGGLCRITFSNFSYALHGQVPRAGARIKAFADPSPPLGADSGDPLSTSDWIPITDESRPIVQLTQNSILDEWSTNYASTTPATRIDKVTLGFHEVGTADDSDEYFLFISKSVPTVTWMNLYLGTAIPLGNRYSGILESAVDVSPAITTVSLLFRPLGSSGPVVPGQITTTTDNLPISEGDLVYFIVAAADFSGNVQYYEVAQGPGNNALRFSQPVYIGGQCPPVDFSATDDDLIHVVGDSTATGHIYGVFGDPGTVNCLADSVKAYIDVLGDGDIATGTPIFIGHGPVNNTNGSFARFDLNMARLPADRWRIFLSTKLGLSETERSEWKMILLDQRYPTAMANTIYDPWNPYLVYGPDDYMNIRMRIDDVCATSTSSYMNDCARVWADFSGIDAGTTAQTGFGLPSAVELVGLGRDRLDNDRDWIKTTDPLTNCDVGYYVGGTQNATTGVWTGGTQVGAGNSIRDFGDPWVDENGNGRYDQGETFIDIVVAGASAGHWDAGEPNLDSNDPDEQGWYEVQKSGATVALSGRGTIKQGYPLTRARVRDLAYTDPFSLVTLNVLDNAIDGATGFTNFMLPASDLNRSLGQTRVLNGTDPERRFLPTIDFNEPTVAEFTSVRGGLDLVDYPNLVQPGNPVYPIGANLDFTISTPSDNDVLMLKMQLKAESATSWTDLNLDPVGDYPLPVAPAVADGLPGVPLYDDDHDGTIDAADLHVIAADDTAACKADLRDNDNDGFFVFRSFQPGDPVTPTAAMGQIWWYNVDERKDTFDDNNDGLLYDVLEGNENTGTNGYNPALDNNEDGIQGGEAVAVWCDGVNVILARNPAFVGNIYVAASKVYGTRTTTYTAGNDSLLSFYANGVAYTEVVERAFGLLTARVATSTTDEQRFFTDGTALASSTTWRIDRPADERLDAATSGTTFGHNWGLNNAFTWSASKGSTLNLDQIARLYGLTTNGLVPYQLRGVPYDLVGNTNERWAEPISFTIDITAPSASIIGCATTTPPTTGDFLDKDPTTATITEIWDAGQHPGTYTLALASVGDDAVSVLFQERRRNVDGTWPETGGPLDDGWADINSTDTSAPFSMEWPAGVGTSTPEMFTVNNYPAGRYQDVQFRALATDSRGNTTAAANACVFSARVIDSTPPSSWIRGVYRSEPTYYEVDDFTPLSVTVSVPQDSSVNVWVRIEDNDRDAKGRLTTLLPGKRIDVLAPVGNGIDDDFDGVIDEVGETYRLTTMWAAGVDGKTGNAGFNDDGAIQGGIDEDDVGGTDNPIVALRIPADGIYTSGLGLGDDRTSTSTPLVAWGAGPDSIPGTADDEWGQGTNNDDYITNDVKSVVWQYRRVNPPTEWLAFATVHGDDGATSGQVYDYTQPMKATLNTTNFVEGTYQLRAYAIDVEGNSNIETAPIATIAVRANPLRAYIQPEVCTDNSSIFDLYAVHFIHDYEIDKVRFEYTPATAAGCAVSPVVWHPIATDEGPGRGDPVLYMPGQFVPVASPDPIEHLMGHAFDLHGTSYKYWDADGDGYYSSRDPIASSTDFTWDGPVVDGAVIGEFPLIADMATTTLREFPEDVFYATDGAEGLNPTAWIFRENSLSATKSAGPDLWNVTWDATGLPAAKYLVRAIAIDAQNNVDDITYTCYEPAVQNPEEVEAIDLSTAPPHAAFTTMIVPDVLPGGSSVNLQQTGVIYVPGSAKWVKLNCAAPDATTKVKFEYKIEGITEWTVITPNDNDLFYADIDGIAGYRDNTGLDETFNDLNGDFVKSAGDFVQDHGEPSGVETPNGWPLYPMTSGEDATYAIRSPFHVYLDTGAFHDPLMTDTSIQLRVTAYDLVCGAPRGDSSPETVTIIWGENTAPEAEIIRAEDQDGALVDVSPATHDENPVGTIGAATNPLRVFVTAQDLSTVNYVDLYYRLDPSCHAPVSADEQLPIDLVVLLDGSAKNAATDWSSLVAGVAAAVGDEGIVPTDGTVSLTVVQFGNGVSWAVLPYGIPKTLITSSTIADSLSQRALRLSLVGGNTPTAAGIDGSVVALGADTRGARQVIIIASDGPPGWPVTNSLGAALAAADSAIAHGVEEIDVIGVGPDADITILGRLNRHGTVEHVSTYAGFSAAIGNKIQGLTSGGLVQLRQWKSMSSAGLTSPLGGDNTYPYDFNIATDLIPDGVYQFYPRAYDKSGNYNVAPVNPWGFKKFALANSDFAFVSELVGERWVRPAGPDTAAVGDEYVIHASLNEALLAPTTAVQFYYAPRILSESIDPATVQPVAPYTSEPLSRSISGAATGDGVVLTINGAPWVWHAVMPAVPDTADFAIVNGNTIAFGVRPVAGDVIEISYNFGDWAPIGDGDSWTPYTVAWQQQEPPAETGIPVPVDPATDAYDLIAIAKFDLNGDTTYETDPNALSDPPNMCDYNEPKASEGHYVLLRDEGKPEVMLYGLAFSDLATTTLGYPDYNWPGNPLFRAGDERRGRNYENKLSGIESDVFVTVDDDIDGADVPSVQLDVSATSVVNGAVTDTTFDMTKISAANENIDIPITFYEDDYPQWAPGSVENVILQLFSEISPGTWAMSRQYEMSALDAATRSRSVSGRFDVGATQRYQFLVDLIGDDQDAVADARNFFDPAGPDPAYSALRVPATPFWYKHFDNTRYFMANAVHRVKVRATDNEGNVGRNGDASGQGPIVFLYDPTPPKVTSIKLLNTANQVLFVDRVGPFGGCSYRLMAEVNDLGTAGGPDVMSADEVAFEYTPNHGGVWVRLGTDADPTDGMWTIDWTPRDPSADGYDNNLPGEPGYGLWDEPGEKQADIEIRVLVYDHARNIGYSDRQTPRLVFPIRVDAAPPIAALDTPWDGQTFAYSDSIRLEGRAWGDTLPAKATNDIDRVRFQAKVTGYFYLDEGVDGVGGSHDGVYDNGIDEIWFDANGDGELTVNDDPAGRRYPGRDGIYYFDYKFGACAFDTGEFAGECQWLKVEDCRADGGVWYEDVPCEVNPHGFGACCTAAEGIKSDGGSVCHVTTAPNCAGTWAAGDCDPSPCVGPPVTGACCVDAGEWECDLTTEEECSGNWYEDTPCDPSPCSSPPLLGKRPNGAKRGSPGEKAIAALSHSEWFDLDPTPQDNGDDPWLTLPTSGSTTWEMTWVPSGFPFITSDELGGDEYIRLRMLSRDAACNEEVLPKETVIVLNDDSVTRAYIHHVGTLASDDLIDPAETKPIQGFVPIVVYGTLQAHGVAEVVQVNLYVVGHPDATTPDAPRLVAVHPLDPTISTDFDPTWDQTDVEVYPEGEYELFATAVDVDQNETSKEEATRVRVRIDRTAPVVNYTPVADTHGAPARNYAGFTTARRYFDDGITQHSSMVIVPDQFTGDVEFTVTTPFGGTQEFDVETVELEWRYPDDPAGVWKPIIEFYNRAPGHTPPELRAFDYEPNQNLFTVAGGDTTMHHVWWLHLENFASNLVPPPGESSGRIQFRALATDLAGNTNAISQTDYAELTADDTDPTGFDWNDDSPTNQIEVGDSVHFQISAQDVPLDDNTRTDIVRVDLFARSTDLHGGQTLAWPDTAYASVVPDSMDLDTGNAMWIAHFTWTAPTWVVRDTDYEFAVDITDAAGNVTRKWQRSNPMITVEDNAAPDHTKMIDVVAEVLTFSPGPPSDANPFVWKDLSTSLAEQSTFQPGTDWLISEGNLPHPPVVSNNGSVGAACYTSPLNVGEGFLGNGSIVNTVKVSNTVTLVARTQSDDYGIGGNDGAGGIGLEDSGVEWVTFLLVKCNANGSAIEGAVVDTLGRDEYRPNFPLFYWHMTFNSKLYDNGTYKLGAFARDEEGNVESGIEWTRAVVAIDNEAPTAQMDANGDGPGVVQTATVERNAMFTLFAKTLKPGTATEENYENDRVEFLYKRTRDLNMQHSWRSILLSEGATWSSDPDLNVPEDGNPDLTRPYSFDVNLGALRDPTPITSAPYPGQESVVPLAVGEWYDFCVKVDDEVCNSTSVVESYADSAVAGVGKRYISLLIQDTIAPHLEITSAQRKGGDQVAFANPTKVHAQGFYYIEARLLVGALDMDRAEFVYRPRGGTGPWTLIDAQLTSLDNGRTWRLGEWDLRPLYNPTPSTDPTIELNRNWYDVACKGIDDVGNVDNNPDIMEVYVDYEAPQFDLVSPSPTTSKWCNGIMDLVVRVTDRGAEQQHDDVRDVLWLWKLSTDPDVMAPAGTADPAVAGWKSLGVATIADLYDDASNKYSNTLNLEGTTDPDGPASALRGRDLALVLDCDAGLTAGDFSFLLSGVADAVENPAIVPQDRSVSITVLQMRNAAATVVVPLTTITSAEVATWVAGEIRDMEQGGVGQALAVGIEGAVDALGGGVPDTERKILLVTAHQPATVSDRDAVIDAADDAFAGTNDSPSVQVNALGVTRVVEQSFLDDVVDGPTGNSGGTARYAPDFANFQGVFGTQLRSLIVSTPTSGGTPPVAIFESNLYDLKVVITDVAGNAEADTVFKNTVDLTPPNYVQISDIKVNGEDTTQDSSDQGQFTDVTAGSMVEIWGTASDDEPALPNFKDPATGVFYETTIATLQFQVAYDMNGDFAADGGEDAWHDIGGVRLDPPTWGDMSAQSDSILWNTSNLPEGNYILRVIATDECGNETIGDPSNVKIIDWKPPIARIVAWDADQQPHGTPAPSFLTIYAMAECDTSDADGDPTNGWQPNYDVQLQYNVKEAGQTVPTGDWVNIGIALPQDAGDHFTTEHIWAATIDPLSFGGTAVDVWLRALVKDESGNRYEDKVPTCLVNVAPIEQVDDYVADGTWTIKQVSTGALGLPGSANMVQNVSWMVKSPTNVVLSVEMTTTAEMPRVVLLTEPAEPTAYPSDDNPLNYSPGYSRDGALVGLTRMVDEPTKWQGEITLEDPSACTHYAFWVSGINMLADSTKWVDLQDAYMREFSVTEALGTNGTVRTPAYGTLGVDVKVLSGAWPGDPKCLLVSPTDPPFLSTDQSAYLNVVDPENHSTAYHLELLNAAEEFVHGYEPQVTIAYSDAAAAVALTGTESSESDLTVRRWDPTVANRDGTTGAWVGQGISQIRPDPLNNKVMFRVRDLSGGTVAKTMTPGGSVGNDITFLIDGTYGVSYDIVQAQLDAVAAAVVNPSIVPNDGSAVITVLGYGQNNQHEIVPPSTVSSLARAIELAHQIQSYFLDDSHNSSANPIATGIESGLSYSRDWRDTATQIFVISVADGRGLYTDPLVSATRTRMDEAEAQAHAAISAGVDEIDIMGIADPASVGTPHDHDLDFLQGIALQGAASWSTSKAAYSSAMASVVSGFASQPTGAAVGNVYQLFAPNRKAPVVVSSIWPSSPYVDNVTDADPVIVAFLRDPGGQVIDPNEVELLIKSAAQMPDPGSGAPADSLLLWATWLSGVGDAEYVRGNGTASLEYANQDRTIMELVYHHSTFPRDWLADGEHTLVIRYKAANGTDKWMEGVFTFNVDQTAPYIEFDGGFVSNPNLRNVVGYMNPADNKLVAKMYDKGMGVLFKHDRPWYFYDADGDDVLDPIERQADPMETPGSFGNWILVDWGVKYDIWRIHRPSDQPPNDPQQDIDNIEVRTLLHQGTADDIEPYIMQNGQHINLGDYIPGDTLVVPVPIIGGGMIQDQDILEITWYSDKTIDPTNDGPGLGCSIDTMMVNGQQILAFGAGCSYDDQSQEMHVYNQGILDWASNSGSKYVEQRFIVDMSCPTITFVEPATSTVDPNGVLRVVVVLADAGVGVDSDSLKSHVTITDPSGNPVQPSSGGRIRDGRYEAIVNGPLVRGEYTVKAEAADLLGNKCEKAVAVKVEALVLAMTEAAVAPNPFNPQGGDKALGGVATIGFNLAKSGDVSIKIYDFAGLEVATVATQKNLKAGYQTVAWAGEADDHTALANGAYICRIMATDGVKTVEQNLKLVIWRE